MGYKMCSVAVAAYGADASAATSFFNKKWWCCSCWLQEQEVAMILLHLFFNELNALIFNALMKMVRNSIQTFSQTV